MAFFGRLFLVNQHQNRVLLLKLLGCPMLTFFNSPYAFSEQGDDFKRGVKDLFQKNHGRKRQKPRDNDVVAGTMRSVGAPLSNSRSAEL